ncbi:MAG: hypothetical protein JKY42_03135 [Flavobacteriales bacterium]|nr:hypothetical protein [Flavobacteriales bacterium]
MATKTDPIQSLTTSATISLTEIVSLKDTIKQYKNTINSLENKNGQLILKLQTEKKAVAKLNGEVDNLNASIGLLKSTQKQLESDKTELGKAVKEVEAVMKKLTGENGDLSKKLKEVEKL